MTVCLDIDGDRFVNGSKYPFTNVYKLGGETYACKDHVESAILTVIIVGLILSKK